MTEKVAVIVLNCNAVRYLQDCFKSIYNQDYPDFEVILVDDNSSDGSASLIAQNFPEVKIIRHDRNLGAPVSFNEAVGQTDAPLLVKLDSDVIVEKDWLSKMVETLTVDAKIGVVGSLVLYHDSDEIQDIGSNIDRFGYQMNYYTLMGLPKDGSRVMDSFYVSGCSMLIKKELFERVGGFDEKYFLYKDDLDLCWRVRLLGYKVVTDLASKIHHVSGVVAGGKTILDASGHYHTTPRKRYYGERNTLRTLLKNYSRSNLVMYLPIYFTILMTEIVFFAFSGQLEVARAYLRAVWWNFTNFKDTWRRRREVQSIRTVSDDEITKNMVKGSSKFNYLRTINAPLFDRK